MDNDDNALDEIELNEVLVLLQDRITTLRGRRLGYATATQGLDKVIESLFVIETKILKMLQ